MHSINKCHATLQADILAGACTVKVMKGGQVTTLFIFDDQQDVFIVVICKGHYQTLHSYSYCYIQDVYTAHDLLQLSKYYHKYICINTNKYYHKHKNNTRF